MKIIHDIYLFLNAIPLYALIFIGFGVFLFLLYMPWIRLFSKPIPFAGVKEEFPDGMTLEELSRIYLQPRGDGKDALNFDRDVDLGKNKVNEALKKEEQGRVDSKENIEEMVLSAGHGQEMHKEFTEETQETTGNTSLEPGVTGLSGIPEAHIIMTNGIDKDRVISKENLGVTKEEIGSNAGKKPEVNKEKIPLAQDKSVSGTVIAGGQWKHPDIEGLYADYVRPNEEIMKKTGSYDAVNKVIKCLDDFGDCQSLTKTVWDNESKQLDSLYDYLKTVTLREHSVAVARAFMKMIKDGNKEGTLVDSPFLIGKYLLIALGHDIGKIPEFIKTAKDYLMMSHEYVSYQLMKSIIPPDLTGADEILETIRGHHEKAKKPLTKALKLADQKTRNNEMGKISLEGTMRYQNILDENESLEQTDNKKDKEKKALPEKIDISWLDIDELLRRADLLINNKDTIKPQAFLKNKTVFINPTLLFNIAIEIAKETNQRTDIVQLAAVSDKDMSLGKKKKVMKQNLEYSIKGALAERKFIPDYIGETFTGGKFDLYDDTDKYLYQGYYMPIRIEAFTLDPSSLESRKGKKLKSIKGVEPAWDI